MLNLSLKAQIFACLFAIIKITTAAVTSQGCYVDDSSLTSLGAYSYQSEGYCAGQCTAQGSAVFAMANGDECACGNTLPSSSVASTNCNTSCVGYPPNTCKCLFKLFKLNVLICQVVVRVSTPYG